MDIHQFWRDVLAQNADAIRRYFTEDASINWHCTNEHFTLEEFIIANCEYPGSWDGQVERIEKMGTTWVTVTHVYPQARTSSFHVTSFLKMDGDRIAALDEYWADDGEAPSWRRDKHIGRAIRQESADLS